MLTVTVPADGDDPVKHAHIVKLTVANAMSSKSYTSTHDEPPSCPVTPEILTESPCVLKITANNNRSAPGVNDPLVHALAVEAFPPTSCCVTDHAIMHPPVDIMSNHPHILMRVLKLDM